MIFLFVILGIVFIVLAAEGSALLLYAKRSPERRKRALEFLLYQKIRPFSPVSHRASHNSISRYSEHPFTGWSLNPEFSNHDGNRIHNRQGFRSLVDYDNLDQADYRIYCAGGSTTYGVYIENNQDTWPELLADYLTNATSQKIQVINGGVGSFTTYQSIIRLSAYIDYLNPDAVVVYHAKNDLTPLWRSSLDDGDASPDYSNKIRPLRFRNISSTIPWLARWSYIFKLWAIFRLSPEDTTMSYVYGSRRPEELETLLAAEVVYTHIDTMHMNMISLCKERGIPVVYMTQRVDHSVFQPYIQAINDRIRTLQNDEQQCFVLDLDRILPHDPTMLLDEMHFSMGGNKVVAESIGDFFLETDGLKLAYESSNVTGMPKL